MKRLKIRDREPVRKVQNGDRVYDASYPATIGVVLIAGEQVSEVKWGTTTPWGAWSYVPNEYLRVVDKCSIGPNS